MPVYWLPKNENTFPPAHLANHDGILALGGDLSVNRLLEAYRQGIFPWFNDNDPIIWWSPDPRFVLYPSELKVSKSMRPYFNQKRFRVTADQNFKEVIEACKYVKRPKQGGSTWITNSMIDGYIGLHQAGYAHSIEVWQEDELVGGLYGVSLGKVFYGESMFSRVSNASKFGFITMTRKLESLGFDLIDCQQKTNYLTGLGGREIPRKTFLQHLYKNSKKATIKGDWSSLFTSGD
jgi:leucyl/phenylalanyl-tRNA--protein transferase